ncbi:MAG: GxxExxY protein [Gemmatimonadota bacterium]|nr:GxxExxY protein [Gemmatimonadota bacterium]
MGGEAIEAEMVHSIVGGFFDVYNYFGYGLSERVYCGALAHELRERGHQVVRELFVEVHYRSRRVAAQRFDMVVDDRVIVENKASEKLNAAARMQIVRYLRATKFAVGLLLHCGPTARFERYIDRPKRQSPTRHRTQAGA